MGVEVGAIGGGLDGVLVVEPGCVVVKEKERLSLISPYSFHSSTSGRSCPCISTYIRAIALTHPIPLPCP